MEEAFLEWKEIETGDPGTAETTVERNLNGMEVSSHSRSIFL